MNYRLALLTASLMLVVAPFAIAGTPTIQGNYIEVRTCDVYTGPCFAMGERGTAGREAILTWDVTKGSHDGVALDGLKVIAVVRANQTLTGDDSQNPYTAKSVLIVDERATEAQATALVSFAKEMGGDLLDNVVRVDASPIEVQAMECTRESCGFVRAKGLVEVSTRCLNGGDKICHNETAFYPPLTPTDSAMAHFAMDLNFHGKGLGTTWSDGDRRSAFLGTFSR